MKKIIIFFLLLRFVLFFVVLHKAPNIIVRGDSVGYEASARALFEDGKFLVSPGSENYQTRRTPGYPFFISLVYRVFGISVIPVVLVQILISFMTVYVTFLIGKSLFNSKVGEIAALLLSLDFASVSFSQYLLTETLFTFFIMLAALFGIFTFRTGKNGWIFGLFLACAVITRPIAYYLVLPIVCALMWFKPKCLVVFLIPYIAIIGGWQLRNYYVSGDSSFSSIQEINFYKYRAASVIAMKDKISYDEAKKKMPECDVKEMTRMGIRIIMENPTAFLKTEMKGFVQLMVIPGVDSFLACFGVESHKDGCFGDLFRLSFSEFILKWMKYPLWLFCFAAGSFFLGGMYFFAVKGVSFSREHLFIIGIVLYLVVISCGVEANIRFRVPIMPFILIFSANGIFKISERGRVSH